MIRKLWRLLDAPAQARTLRDQLIQAAVIVPIVTVIATPIAYVVLRLLGAM